MPRSTIQLDVHREEIINWQAAGASHSQMASQLKQQYGITIGVSTLRRRLQEMNVRTHHKRLDKDSLNSLRLWLSFIFHQLRLTDDETLYVLAAEGFEMNKRTLRRRRQQLGLYKHLQTHNRQELLQYIEDVLVFETAQGRIECLGRHHLYAYMRSRYNVIGRDRIFSTAVRLNPEGYKRRKALAQEHRGQLVTSGPNEVWSMDAYCKFELWGIQIYGCCDVYSRHLIWIYVGITARTALSVASQYLHSIAETGIMPTLIRSDMGAETPICADAHYNLRVDCEELPLDEEDEPEDYLPFRNCFRYGTSRKNVRIEKWWGEQSKSALNRWRDCFLQYSNDGIYQPDSQGNRIAFLAIYVPILREELQHFTELWNMHRIRHQRNREDYLIPGIPHMLYHYPERTGGIEMGRTPKPETIQAMLNGICEFGKESAASGSPFDPETDLAVLAELDEFLPPQTLQWCIRYLESKGFPSYVDGTATNQDGERLHKLAYQCLIEGAITHIASGQEPELFESVKPYANGQWLPSARLQRVFDDAGIELPGV